MKTIKNKTEFAKPANLNWRKLNGEILITNEYGYHCRLKEEDFRRLTGEKLEETDPLTEELADKGFIHQKMDFVDLTEKWKSLNSHLNCGPALHILIMTTRCNTKCVYCQAGALGTEAKDHDMSWETAKKAVDLAFCTTAPALAVEFQGGEPLLNWEVIIRVIEYAREKEKNSGKKLSLSLVSNMMLMTEEKADFLLRNEVSVCTSLDGPEKVHDKNRVFPGGAYKTVKKWLKYFKERHDGQTGDGARIFKPSALLTVTKNSLDYPKEIVDEYADSGLDGIFLRPVAPIGYAKRGWDKIGYSADEFLKFYGTALDYIIDLNKNGRLFLEKYAVMFLTKIINFDNCGNMDLSCPCGAGLGQIAYNYNGKIYTCDEGRMLAMDGDELFNIGTVDDEYKKLMSSVSTRACACASELHEQPQCSRCAYQPYCGVCPVFNYSVQGSIYGDMAGNMKCAINMGILDLLFTKMKDSENKEVFKKWVSK